MKIGILTQTTFNFALILLNFVQELIISMDPVIDITLKILTIVVSLYTIIRLREQVHMIKLDRRIKQLDIEDKERKVQEYFELKYNDKQLTNGTETNSKEVPPSKGGEEQHVQG